MRHESISQQGVTWDLQAGVAAIFFKAMIMASIALLISTFSSSTLFTIVAGFAVYLIGLGQALAREYFIDGALSGAAAKLVGILVALIFPDFQMFDIVDGVVNGIPVAWVTMAKLGGLTLFYLSIYVMVSYLIFAEKEL